jgi:hypothetical protein
MHIRLTQLKAYHKSLGLNVGHYHLDPFWWSQQPLGGCEDGATASNMSASPWHFAGQQINTLGLEMQLIVKYIASANVYTPEYTFDGNQVAGKDAYRFYHWFFQYHYNASNLRSLVWDGLDVVWLSSDKRVTSVTEQSLWHAGFANAATELGLPMRVDMSLPSDTLASVQYPSHTVGRCMPDATPGDQNAWMDIAGNSLLLSVLGVRPMMDVLWSQSTQPGNPYAESRPNVEHDFIFTTLSTGPVGIGDMLECTNVSLINAAIRSDGVILKPSAAAMRLDRFYSVPHHFTPPPPPPPAPPPPCTNDGCADGTCEAFCDHPSVRGCQARWNAAVSLRKAPTGKVCGAHGPHCGNASIPCASPADACGDGWAICLSHSGPGFDTPTFIAAMDPKTCGSVDGAFLAAMSHVAVEPSGERHCPDPANPHADNTCKSSGYGSEPLCCGTKCLVPSCSTALWNGSTRALIGTEGSGSCGAVSSRIDPEGVLCCKRPTPPQPREQSEFDLASQDEQKQRYEVTAAPAAPAAHASSLLDGDADSRADLEREGKTWWWNILSTDKLSPDSSLESSLQAAATTSNSCLDVQNNTAFGGDPIGVDHTATTPELCCAACMKEPRCQVWNLNGPQYAHEKRAGCFFKGVGNTRHAQQGVVAGSRAGPALPEAAAAPLRLAEMWPASPASAVFWVQEWGNASCANGTLASSCLSTWSKSSPLDIAATAARHRRYPQTTRLYRFFRAAPVLESGWTLLGELIKFVPVSPQRLVLADSSSDGTDDALLSFGVLGASGEMTRVAMVTPQSRILWLNITLGSSGAATVQCTSVTCHYAQ